MSVSIRVKKHTYTYTNLHCIISDLVGKLHKALFPFFSSKHFRRAKRVERRRRRKVNFGRARNKGRQAGRQAVAGKSYLTRAEMLSLPSSRQAIKKRRVFSFGLIAFLSPSFLSNVLSTKNQYFIHDFSRFLERKEKKKSGFFFFFSSFLFHPKSLSVCVCV